MKYCEARQVVSAPHCPVCLLNERDELRAEVERLRGARPELPLREIENGNLPRYGLRWNGPKSPVPVPVDDGYWTPWHLAKAEIERLRGDAESVAEVMQGKLGRELSYRHDDLPPVGTELYAHPPAAVPGYSGWYCAHCQRGVDPSEVTYHEAHTECGRIITDDEPPAPAGRSVYEAIDTTDDENYFPLGIFSTVENAREFATAGEFPPSDFAEESCRIEIRKRRLDSYSSGGAAVESWRWEHDPESDDGTWLVKQEPGR